MRLFSLAITTAVVTLLASLSLAAGLDSVKAVVSPTAANAVSAQQVKIVTDSAGIPHITASNYESLGYGEAYSFAGDDFCTLAQDFVTVEGERSRYFGPNALATNYAAATDPTNLQSDMFWQAVIKSDLFQKETSAPPPIGPLPQVSQLFEGYVKGYNAYLSSGKLRDPACAGKPWVHPITLEDLFLREFEIFTTASSQLFITNEASAVPPSPGSSAKPVVSASAVTRDLSELQDIRESGDSSTGSNGIAVGSKDTQAGTGMVLANPHFPWVGVDRFWMAQLTVPGSYNVEGGTLMGFPLVGIGFNSNVSWTHTEATAYEFTMFQLKLVPGEPTSYYVDGKAVPMGKVTVTVDTGNGSVRHTFYTTRWGTVLDIPGLYDWTASTAYTVDDVDLTDEWRTADEYFEMGRATSVRGLLTVEKEYLAVPFFNTIAADKRGNVLYADMGNIPNVSSQLIQECLPAGVPTLAYQEDGLITLDGSRSGCGWQTAKGTPVPGILGADQMPYTIRTDYVENSNDSYWLANPSAPFPAYSPIIGNIDEEQGLRTRLGNEMIAARVAGTDGLGKPKFTLATMTAMWENDRSLAAELVLKPLVTACQAAPIQQASDGTTVDLTSACDALAGYEKYENGDLDASGGWLFTLWYDSVDLDSLWTTPFSAAHPLTTPSGLDTSNPEVLSALADAVLSMQADDINVDASFGQVQHATRGADVIPIHGCATGCFNAIYTSLGDDNPFYPGNYGEVGEGSSMVFAVSLGAAGPSAQGILTYSQATNPLSPWYSNMTELYSQKKWVPLPYTAAQLAAQPGNQTVVLTVGR